MAEMLREWLGNKNKDLREHRGYRQWGWEREEGEFRGGPEQAGAPYRSDCT